MTAIKTCSVKILNKVYEIKCPEGEVANLMAAAQRLNEQIASNKSKARMLDHFQLLLLSALDISRELIVCKSEQEQQRHQVTQFISSLENKIHKMVGGELETIVETD